MRFDGKAVARWALIMSFFACLVAADNPPPLFWQYPLTAPSFGSAAVGDIDNDGKPEVVFGTYFGDEHAYALNGEDGSLKWRFDTGGGPLDASASLADVNQDGKLEVLIAASWGIQYCLDGDGQVIWQYPSTGYIDCIDSPPAVADVDADGKPEVVFGAWSGKVYVLNGEDGTLVWVADLGADDYIQSEPAVLDVDGDGGLDIVVASFSAAAKVWALRGTDKHLLWTFQAGDMIYHGTSFGDIDEDGRPELAFSCYDGYIYVLNAEDGSELWKYPTGEYAYSPVALADLDGDGHLEVAAGGNSIFVVSHTGSLQWRYPTGGAAFRGPTVADVDGDGALDLAFGSGDTILRVLKGIDGAEIWTWNLGGDNEIDHAPVFADLDGDGDLELFFVAGYWDSPNNHGQAYAVHTGSGTGPGWPMFTRDLVHSGCFCEARQAALYRSTVDAFAPGWQSLSLPLTSQNDLPDAPFPVTTSLPGTAQDTLATSAPLVLYRLLGDLDAPMGNRLRAAKVPAGVELTY